MKKKMLATSLILVYTTVATSLPADALDRAPIQQVPLPSSTQNALAPLNDVSTYLATTKSRFDEVVMQPPRTQPMIHVVMGNESADMDSIVSAIAYAYLLSRENPDTGVLFLPLINIPREDVEFRRDVLLLMQQMGLSVGDLVFLDNASQLDQLHAEGKLRLHLVDHNILNPSQAHLSTAVTEIIDHHPDWQVHYPLLKPEDRVIERVGAATTLVADRYLSSEHVTLTPGLATFLLAPILMDTRNLTSGEMTGHDCAVVAALLVSTPDILPAEYYQQLHNARLDVEGMTPELLLKKDYKSYAAGPLLYGTARIRSPAAWWHDDEQALLPVLHNFTEERALDLVILLMDHPGASKRRLMLFCPQQELLQAIDEYFLADELLSEVLTRSLAQGDSGQVTYYESHGKLSRKMLQPMLHFSSIGRM